MTFWGVVQIVVYLVILAALAKPLGWYMARVYEGQPTPLDRVLGPVERLLYRVFGAKPDQEMDWKTYAVAMIFFNAIGLVGLYALVRLQSLLPLNPQGLGAVSPDLSWNTAVSFATNTNWQNYGGETTMSYLTQMLGLAFHNFVSAATGMAVLVALIRGFARRSAKTIGNFWVDITRGTLYILMPLSFVLALILVSQGVVQTFTAYPTANLVQPTSYQQPQLDANGSPVTDPNGNPVTETVRVKQQVIAVGPAASQIAIKQLGTNGGGVLQCQLDSSIREPDAIHELFGDAIDPAHSGRTLLYLRQNGRRHATGLGCPCRYVHRPNSYDLCRLCRRVIRQPEYRGVGCQPGLKRYKYWRQHGGKGSPLRSCQLCDLGYGHDRCFERLGQLYARLVYSAWRLGADRHARVQRGGVWRSRVGTVWDARICHRRGLCRGADGRANARVPWQEDRGI